MFIGILQKIFRSWAIIFLSKSKGRTLSELRVSFKNLLLTLQEAIATQNFFLLNSETKTCQSKPKRDNFISKIFCVCRWQKTSRPEQKVNKRASYQSRVEEGRSWKKRKTKDRETGKKNIRHVCGKGNLSQCHASLGLTMGDQKQTFLNLKTKHKQVGDSQWKLQLCTYLAI